jgi:5-methyltetrahydrofolate--homocysteine methyltransferase
MIKSTAPVRTICGLSNVSFGLPNRSLINSVFLSMACQKGLDAAIIDPTDKNMIAAIKAASAIICEDEYCIDYIKAHREGRL